MKSILAPLALISSAAWAQERTDWIPILEPSPNGGLVHTGQFDYEKNFASGIWIETGPPTAIVLQNGRQTPIVTQKGLSFLNQTFGGTGEIEIKRSGQAATSKPIDLDALVAAAPPMELFEDDGGPAIQPQDGVWSSTLDIISETGCPAGIAAAASASLGLSQSKQITFTKPNWQPGDFGPHFAGMEWQKTGENVLVAAPYDAPQNTREAGFAIIVQMQMKALSDTKFDVRGRVWASFSPEMARIVGSSEDCIVVARGFYTKQ